MGAKEKYKLAMSGERPGTVINIYIIILVRDMC